MKARDAISLVKKSADENLTVPSVSAGMHLLEVLPQLVESPTHQLKVTDSENSELGMIDSHSLLEAMARQIASRYDCSIIEINCAPADYSASALARAVEDTDAHLVDLLTAPTDEGMLHVTLRVRCEDPTAAVHSLERYGYTVTEMYGHENVDVTASVERLLALQALINV